jgi:hypothetical protein
MALPAILLNIITSVQGSAQVQALRAGLSSLAAAARTGIANPFSNLASGADRAAQSFLGAHAGLISLAGAAAAAGAAFKAGLNINAEVESSTLGIKALVAGMYDVRDASGGLAKGPEQLAIAGEIANNQIQKLRIAGLETAASFQQLVEAFQQGIGAGASAGLGLDQVRELTIGIVQAASALNVPMHQLNQEVRSLLSGQITSDSTVAKALQITNSQMKEWTKSGKVFDELNKRFDIYKRTGAEAALTWKATFSNLGEAVSMFLGTASAESFTKIKKSIQSLFTGLFDVKTGGVSEQFQALQNILTRIFGTIGTEISGAIDGLVQAAKDLSAWFDKNAVAVETIGIKAGLVWDNLKAIGGLLIGIVSDTANAGVQTGFWDSLLNNVAIGLATIVDGFRLLGSYVDVIRAKWNKDSDPLKSAELFKNAAATQEALMKGEGAVGRTKDRIRESGALALKNIKDAETARKAALDKANKPATGTATNKAKVASDDDKKKAAAEAKAAQKAGEALAKAEMENVKKVAAALREEKLAQADADLAAGKLSQDAYLELKRQAQQEEYALDLKALQQERDFIAQRATTKTSEVLAKQADLKKVDTEIQVLAEKDRTAKIKLVAEAAQFNRQVADLEIEFKAKILDAQGDAIGAAAVRRQAAYAKLQKSAEYQASPSIQADSAKDEQLAADKDSYDRAKEAYAAHLADLDNLDKEYKQQVELGTLTTLDAETKMAEARRTHVDAMQEQLDMMTRLADASNNPSMIAAAKSAKIELNGIKNTADSVATAINKNLSQAIVDGFGGILSGSMSVKDALRSILMSVIDTWKKIAAQKLAEAMFGKLGGATSALGGNASSAGINWSGLISSGASMLGFAEGGVVPTGVGGIIRGAGTGTSDSITARLSNGEGILTAAAVRKYGANFVHSLNRLAKGYATGGIVGGASTGEIASRALGLGPKPAAASPQPARVRIINGIDPSVTTSHMDSAEGEQVIENIISRNSARFRLAMGV